MSECNCSDYVFREGVHLPGCSLHPSNLKQQPTGEPKCKTCGDLKIVCPAGLINGGIAEPCPDCQQPTAGEWTKGEITITLPLSLIDEEIFDAKGHLLARCFRKDVSEFLLSQVGGYLEGYKTALRQYAWWKDGVEYVGTCGKTLKEALDDIEEELRRK